MSSFHYAAEIAERKCQFHEAAGLKNQDTKCFKQDFQICHHRGPP
jgi:hypothetical protein